MDPNRAWTELSQVVAEDDWDSATEIAESLAEWMLIGGFPPTITGNANFDRIVTRSTVQSIATWEVA